MADQNVLAVLRSIDSSLKQLVQIAQRRQQTSSAPASAPVAPDSDLDSPHGDPVIRAKDPRDWSNGSMMGRRFSQCPPAYLDLLAQRYDYFAQKAEAEGATASNGQPLAPYNRRDAARARGWARRLRNGWKPPQTDADFSESDWPAGDSDSF